MFEQLLHGHNDEVDCVALLSNGQVASGSSSGSIIIHSSSSNNIEYRADNVFANGVFGLCYLPNGSLVACGDDDEGTYLKVFSPSLELVQTLVGHNATVRCVTVSPSFSHFASGGRDKKVMIWSEPGENGEWARVQVFEDHTNTIYAVCFSPDCKTLCSGSWDESIKFWNPADGSLVKSIDLAHTSSVYSVSYSPNGRVLVSAGDNKTMKIWDAETFELKHTFEQEFITSQLTITADSNYIVSANSDKTVRIIPCREHHITCLDPILNLILHIVYKWEFVSFPKKSRRMPEYIFETIRLLGECVHEGGYNVTSEILSFLSPAHLPVQITPTRWKRNPESLIVFMRAKIERDLKKNVAKEAAMKTVMEQQRVEIEGLRQRIAELEPDEDY